MVPYLVVARLWGWVQSKCESCARRGKGISCAKPSGCWIVTPTVATGCNYNKLASEGPCSRKSAFFSTSFSTFHFAAPKPCSASEHLSDCWEIPTDPRMESKSPSATRAPDCTATASWTLHECLRESWQLQPPIVEWTRAHATASWKGSEGTVLYLKVLYR